MERFRKRNERFVSKVECYEVPGTHDSFLNKKNAKVLAECLNRILSNL